MFKGSENEKKMVLDTEGVSSILLWGMTVLCGGLGLSSRKIYGVRK